MENLENIEIYFDCQPLPSDEEMVGEMALSMPENYIVRTIKLLYNSNRTVHVSHGRQL